MRKRSGVRSDSNSSGIPAQADDLNDLPPEINAATRARLALAIGLFDRNHDGKLDADERKALMDFLRARLQ